MPCEPAITPRPRQSQTLHVISYRSSMKMFT